MKHKYKHDSNRVKNRQSKDFQDIWNVQTDMNVSQEAWDTAFHNYDNPGLCPGRKRPLGCTVCDRLLAESGVGHA